MNPDLLKLQPYPFEKLAALTSDIIPPAGIKPVSLSIGEPEHPVPEIILNSYRNALGSIGNYPTTLGMEALRQAIASWLIRRFSIHENLLDIHRHILPVNGTREALFAFAQTIIRRDDNALVLMPNPCYQIYEGAALLAGARPVYLPCTADQGFLPDLQSVTDSQWRECQLFYLCSPGNPTGAVFSSEQLKQLIELAQRYDFVIASDECYSEIYQDEAHPPSGLLQAATEMGLDDFRRCVVFHSLSKRSNVPGMRSGFVAGDADILQAFRRYRTYHGCTMSPAVQTASITAWEDEDHVRDNRDLYRQKFNTFLDTLGDTLNCKAPAGSFYLWPQLPVDDCEFTYRLLKEKNVKVVPGSYLSRDVDGFNPGRNYVRISLVASVEDCREAATRIRELLVDW